MTELMISSLPIRFELDHPTLRLGVVHAHGVSCGPSSPELLERLNHAEAEIRQDPTRFAETTRAALRNVLRKGGYKPTGRGKPASEFLLGAALDTGMPRINNLVDINNLVSLRHAYPVSILDAVLLGGEISLRFGRKGEAYVFNPSGHQMDIEGLPVVCRGAQDEPVGNAVKDSMLCKVHADTHDVVAVVYGTSELPVTLIERACAELSQLFTAYAGARSTTTQVLP